MKSQWTGDQNWVTCLLIFVVLLLLAGLAYPKEVRMIPFVVGFPTLLLLLFLWVGNINPVVGRWVEMAARGRRSGEKKSGEPSKGSEFTEWGRVLVIMAWVFLFFAFVFLFGFALVSPLFIALFLVRKAGFRKGTALVYAVTATILIYLFMQGVIKADLWSGAIPSIIPGILGGAIVPPL